MACAGDTDSLFKRDEPVSGSRKWMLVIFYAWILFMGVVLFVWYVEPQFLLAQIRMGEALLPMWYIIRDPDFYEIYGFLLMIVFLFIIIAGMILMTVQLRRIARTARLCREKRNFEMMAAAVRSQGFLWGLFAVGSLVMMIFNFSVCFQLNSSIQAWTELVKKEKDRREQMSAPVP